MAHRTALLLGAGASRAVSNAGKRSIRSLLDADFFELLQKVEAKDKDDRVDSVDTRAHSPVWNSMERTFYTLHMRARMQAVQQQILKIQRAFS